MIHRRRCNASPSARSLATVVALQRAVAVAAVALKKATIHDPSPSPASPCSSRCRMTGDGFRAGSGSLRHRSSSLDALASACSPGCLEPIPAFGATRDLLHSCLVLVAAVARGAPCPFPVGSGGGRPLMRACLAMGLTAPTPKLTAYCNGGWLPGRHHACLYRSSRHDCALGNALIARRRLSSS